MKKKLIVLSGAGISAESGLQTFRSGKGLWEEFDLEKVATPAAWKADPELVQSFYNARRAQISKAQPNSAHLLLVDLEKEYDVTIITQNIDDLHERAGSAHVIHLHGNIRFSKSSGPNQEKTYFPVDGDTLSVADHCPDGYPLRPHVVWFGEDVPLLQKAAEILSTADVFLVVGTSLSVYPAAQLVHYAPTTCQCFVIDPEADHLRGLQGFTALAKNASEGMLQFLELLKKGN